MHGTQSSRKANSKLTLYARKYANSIFNTHIQSNANPHITLWSVYAILIKPAKPHRWKRKSRRGKVGLAGKTFSSAKGATAYVSVSGNYNNDDCFVGLPRMNLQCFAFDYYYSWPSIKSCIGPLYYHSYSFLYCCWFFNRIFNAKIPHKSVQRFLFALQRRAQCTLWERAETRRHNIGEQAASQSVGI